jgi:PAS domain S-box-containing protein
VSDHQKWLNELVRDTLAPSALMLALVASALVLVVPMVQPPEVASPVTRVVAAVAFLDGVTWLLLRKRTPPAHLAHPISAWISATVLLAMASVLAHSPDPRQTTILMLVAVASGGLLASRRWLAVHLAGVFAVFALGALSAPSDPQWLHFGFSLAFSFALAVLFHEVRLRMLGRLGASRADFARELGERGRAEDALRQSEARFRQIFEAAPVMMHSLDTDGRLISVNSKWLEETGYEREDVIGRSVTAVLTPESAERVVRDGLPRLWREGGMRDIEIRIVRKDRSVFDARVDATVVRGEGALAVDLAVLRNVSASKRAALERERLRQQLFEARKLESLGLLAGGIAHDFNNLLAAILGNAHLALETLPEDHEERGALDEIRAAAERGALLTRQLLSYAGRAPVERVPVDLSGQIREVARITQSALSSTAALRFDLADSLPAVEVDPGQLQQVIMNLLRNAADALGPEGGEIAVRTGLARLERAELAGLVAGAGLEPGLYVHFDIADDGCGMDSDTRDHLFDPFFTSKQSGHGLGLPVALGVVRAHGGGIAVDSTPGAGTCFRVYLPASSRAPQAVAADAPAELAGSGRVLVADDEAPVRRVARRVLERLGYEVVEASDGDTARERMREADEPFTAAVLDLRMPGGGVETAHALRAIDPELPILIQSGFDPDGAVERLGIDGAVGFVAKPFTPQALGAALRILLAGAGRKRETTPAA